MNKKRICKLVFVSSIQFYDTNYRKIEITAQHKKILPKILPQGDQNADFTNVLQNLEKNALLLQK